MRGLNVKKFPILGFNPTVEKVLAEYEKIKANKKKKPFRAKVRRASVYTADKTRYGNPESWFDDCHEAVIVGRCPPQGRYWTQMFGVIEFMGCPVVVVHYSTVTHSINDICVNCNEWITFYNQLSPEQKENYRAVCHIVYSIERMERENKQRKQKMKLFRKKLADLQEIEKLYSRKGKR